MSRAASKTSSASASGGRKPSRASVVDLPNYAPAYFTWIANKLSGGASKAYLAAFDVGIETWRVLVLLAIDDSVSASRVVKVIGMDKASVSRVFKSMQGRGLVTMGLDPQDGRVRVATITVAGRELHDQILRIALERDRALLSVLSPEERDVLLSLLRRLHDNLPAVEEATAKYLTVHFPHAARRRRKSVSEE